jgi:hypothetical protein
MNGNNSWKRMGKFVNFPERDLGPDYGEGRDQPTGKKILGMPKDRFIALMGTIAQAFGGDTPSGRMGAGLINMADIMRQERMGQAETRAAEAKAKREAAAGTAKERRAAAVKEREKKEKIPSAWEAFYTEKKSEIDPETKFPYTAAKIHTAFKKTGEKKPTIPKGQADFEQIEGVWHAGYQHFNPETKKYDFIPTREATKAEIAKTEVKPIVGKEPLTPDKAREKLFAIAKFKSSLSKTGGWNETVFELMAQKDPEFAKRALSINSSKAEVNTTIKELENYYKGIVSGKPIAKKEETFDIEEQDARDAINQGIPADRVREMYKKRTGKELGF